MLYKKSALLVYFCALVSGGCDSKFSQATDTVASQTSVISADLVRVKQENETLRAEVAALNKKLNDALINPPLLLARVTEAIVAEKMASARQASAVLETHFPDSVEARNARAAIAKYDAELVEKKKLQDIIDARGFYALQPQKAPVINGVTVKTESLVFGARWQFNDHDNEWNYRDAERGERFVLLKAFLSSVDKDPKLPDLGLYLIEGKGMTRIGQFQYEFRRWSNYGTYIGLYHDYKNDFSHTQSIPFNAAAAIKNSDSKLPFAVVATGESCHERVTKIGQPEVGYRPAPSCVAKKILNIEDFTRGNYKILAFFNKPKGS
ncbi:MAG: hypothetical protein M9919_15070 [Burkholderiaceae bacterium]|nr:hypothetical protein [Burkholderiaceae bacterium]